MNEIIADLKAGLNAQLSSLADEIRSTEEKLLRTKEGYLKVQGALEIIEVLLKRKQEQEAEAVKTALGGNGAD
jgi:septal ring factor EnvC (AmiA/AmiB activator)